MMAKALDVLLQTRWMVGDGRSINFMTDSWIVDVPLARWPIFISMDIPGFISIFDILVQDGTQWNLSIVIRIFGDILGQRVLSIALPLHPCSDIRVWRISAYPRVPTYTLCIALTLRKVLTLDRSSFLGCIQE